MDARVMWSQVAAEVLNEPSATRARARLSAALLAAARATQAARVHVAPGGQASWFVTGEGAPDTVDRLPPGSAVNAHPLHRFHRDTGVQAPALLPEVIRQGWDFRRETLELVEQLGLTLEQLSVPIETPSEVNSGYDGWVMVSDNGFHPDVLSELAAVQDLVRGLDRHVRMMGRLTEPPSGSTLLTPRERLVLSMLARGSTVEGIAARLLISPRTVHKHQEHLYRKLGAVDRLSAVLRAQELGLLARPEPEPTWPPAQPSSPTQSVR